MTPLQLLESISFTGPNEDGDYNLHFRKSDGSGAFGVCLPRSFARVAGQHIEQWEAKRREIINREAE